MNKYPCIESTVEFYIGSFHVRLWIAETDLLDGYPSYSGILPKAEDFMVAGDMGIKDLIEFIIKQVPRLNAVQVIGRERTGVKQGIMVYAVDF